MSAIVYTKYTISLDRLSAMFETGNPRLLKRSRLVPDFIAREAYRRFMFQFNELFNAQEVESALSSDIMKAKIANKINVLLPALYHGLMLAKMYGIEDKYTKDFRDEFRKMYNREFRDLSDLDFILQEIKRLGGKMKELYAVLAQPVQQARKISFEEIIAATEMILERPIDRSMKLYQFKYQYDLAMKRAREMDRQHKQATAKQWQT
jgi:hypothetical protein